MRHGSRPTISLIRDGGSCSVLWFTTVLLQFRDMPAFHCPNRKKLWMFAAFLPSALRPDIALHPTAVHNKNKTSVVFTLLCLYTVGLTVEAEDILPPKLILEGVNSMR